MGRFDFGELEYGRGVAIDQDGNIVLSGDIAGPGRSCDILLIKCDSFGDTIWTRTYGKSSEVEQSWRITTDSRNNIYIAGNYTIGVNGIEEAGALLLKFSSDGSLLWVERYNLPNVQVVFLDVVTDNQGNIYVAGVVDSMYPFPTQYGILCQYDTSGNLVRERIYEWTNLLLGITRGPNGNLYLTGEDESCQTLTLCLDSLGDTIWARSFSWNEPYSYSRGNGLALDPLGNVVVTGFIVDTMEYFDLTLIKYAPNGETVWTRRVNFLPYDIYDWGFDVATDRSGNIYIAGDRGAIFYIGDYWTIKYSPAGETIWTASYGRARCDDWAYSIIVDHSGNPIVIGQSEVEIGNYDVVAIKYCGATGIEQDRFMLALGNSALKITPNPAKEMVILQLAFETQEVLLYDIVGKLLKVFPVNGKREVPIPLNGVPNGTYFLKAKDNIVKFVKSAY